MLLVHDKNSIRRATSSFLLFIYMSRGKFRITKTTYHGIGVAHHWVAGHIQALSLLVAQGHNGIEPRGFKGGPQSEEKSDTGGDHKARHHRPHGNA